jgi:hypothetical protein
VLSFVRAICHASSEPIYERAEKRSNPRTDKSEQN